jgi:hypothetical protein
VEFQFDEVEGFGYRCGSGVEESIVEVPELICGRVLNCEFFQDWVEPYRKCQRGQRVTLRDS